VYDHVAENGRTYHRYKEGSKSDGSFQLLVYDEVSNTIQNMHSQMIK
jgi:hypothetical protein